MPVHLARPVGDGESTLHEYSCVLRRATPTPSLLCNAVVLQRHRTALLLLADTSVDRLAEEVCMAGMAGRLLDEVKQHPPSEKCRPSRNVLADSWSRSVALEMIWRLRSQATR